MKFRKFMSRSDARCMLTVHSLVLTFSTKRHCWGWSPPWHLFPRSVSSPETESGDNCLCGRQARAECDQWPMAPGGDCQGWHRAALSSQASARPRQVSRTAGCSAIYYRSTGEQSLRDTLHSSFFVDQWSIHFHFIVSSVVATFVHY